MHRFATFNQCFATLVILFLSCNLLFAETRRLHYDPNEGTISENHIKAAAALSDLRKNNPNAILAIGAAVESIKELDPHERDKDRIYSEMAQAHYAIATHRIKTPTLRDVAKGFVDSVSVTLNLKDRTTSASSSFGLGLFSDWFSAFIDLPLEEHRHIKPGIWPPYSKTIEAKVGIAFPDWTGPSSKELAQYMESPEFRAGLNKFVMRNGGADLDVPLEQYLAGRPELEFALRLFQQQKAKKQYSPPRLKPTHNQQAARPTKKNTSIDSPEELFEQARVIARNQDLANSAIFLLDELLPQSTEVKQVSAIIQTVRDFGALGKAIDNAIKRNEFRLKLDTSSPQGLLDDLDEFANNAALLLRGVNRVLGFAGLTKSAQQIILEEIQKLKEQVQRLHNELLRVSENQRAQMDQFRQNMKIHLDRIENTINRNDYELRNMARSLSIGQNRLGHTARTHFFEELSVGQEAMERKRISHCLTLSCDNLHDLPPNPTRRDFEDRVSVRDFKQAMNYLQQGASSYSGDRIYSGPELLSYLGHPKTITQPSLTMLQDLSEYLIPLTEAGLSTTMLYSALDKIGFDRSKTGHPSREQIQLLYAALFLKYAHKYSAPEYEGFYSRRYNLERTAEKILADLHRTKHAKDDLFAVDDLERPNAENLLKLLSNHQHALGRLSSKVKKMVHKKFENIPELSGYDPFRPLVEQTPVNHFEHINRLFTGGSTNINACEDFQDQNQHAGPIHVTSAKKEEYLRLLPKELLRSAVVEGGQFELCYTGSYIDKYRVVHHGPGAFAPFFNQGATVLHEELWGTPALTLRIKYAKNEDEKVSIVEVTAPAGGPQHYETRTYQPRYENSWQLHPSMDNRYWVKFDNKNLDGAPGPDKRLHFISPRSSYGQYRSLNKVYKDSKQGNSGFIGFYRSIEQYYIDRTPKGPFTPERLRRHLSDHWHQHQNENTLLDPNRHRVSINNEVLNALVDRAENAAKKRLSNIIKEYLVDDSFDTATGIGDEIKAVEGAHNLTKLTLKEYLGTAYTAEVDELLSEIPDGLDIKKKIKTDPLSYVDPEKNRHANSANVANASRLVRKFLKPGRVPEPHRAALEATIADYNAFLGRNNLPKKVDKGMREHRTLVNDLILNGANRKGMTVAEIQEMVDFSLDRSPEEKSNSPFRMVSVSNGNQKKNETLNLDRSRAMRRSEFYLGVRELGVQLETNEIDALFKEINAPYEEKGLLVDEQKLEKYFTTATIYLESELVEHLSTLELLIKAIDEPVPVPTPAPKNAIPPPPASDPTA